MGGERPEGRAKYLRVRPGEGVGNGAAENDTTPAFTVTRGELRALVAEAVAEALEAERPGPPALLTRQQLASVFGCSPSLIDKFLRQGLPCIRLGDSPRFQVEAALEWLRSGERKAGGA